MGAVRAEAEAARAAEAAAIELAQKAADDAEKKVLEGYKTESQATAKLQVKSKEAAALTSECSALRAEATLLREKGEASASVIKALTSTCEALKLQLSASEAKHDWSKLQQLAPAVAQEVLTFEDFEDALTAPSAVEVPAPVDASATASTTGKRLRSKGPESRLSTLAASTAAVQAVEAPEAEVALTKRPRKSKATEPTAVPSALQKPPSTRVITPDTVPQVGDEIVFQSYQGCRIAEILKDGCVEVAIVGLGKMKAAPGQWKLKGQVAIDAD